MTSWNFVNRSVCAVELFLPKLTLDRILSIQDRDLRNSFEYEVRAKSFYFSLKFIQRNRIGHLNLNLNLKTNSAAFVTMNNP